MPIKFQSRSLMGSHYLNLLLLKIDFHFFIEVIQPSVNQNLASVFRDSDNISIIIKVLSTNIPTFQSIPRQSKDLYSRTLNDLFPKSCMKCEKPWCFSFLQNVFCIRPPRNASSNSA